MTNTTFTTPGEEVRIFLPDGKTIQGKRGAPIADFLTLVNDPKNPIAAAIINNKLSELTTPVEIESFVKPVHQNTADGARIYRRSLTFLLEAAFNSLYPEYDLTVDHSVFSGGYYCHVQEEFFDQAHLDKLKAYMHDLVAQNIPLKRIRYTMDEAIAFFKEKGFTDKLSLMKSRDKDFVMLYQLGDYTNHNHGYLVPSTGYLQWFELTLLGHGFILRFPRRQNPTKIDRLQENKNLLSTFKDYAKWLNRLGISDVGQLNEAIRKDQVQEVILISEALHEHRIANIAKEIVENKDKINVILIAGPSSSGKTTFSKRLTIQLLAYGVSPYPVEIDNFFVNRELTPRDEDGEYDFESIDAIDRKLLSQKIKQLISGEKTQLPKFNFIEGKSEPGEIVQVKPGQILILEGIHCLNPALLPEISEDQTYRIYASALTQLNFDKYNRVSTTDTRLIRRIVRDKRTRGYSALDTIKRWESVGRGEKRNIFPYQEYANVIFNTALVYDLAVLKPFAEPILRQVPQSAPEYVEVKRLLSMLEWFEAVEHPMIPSNSLILEFVGGSVLKDFKVWEHPGPLH